jgi:hypothetical protein
MIKNIVIFQLAIVLIVGTGWVKNIIKLTECDFESPVKAEIVHILGVFPPVGMITGWLDMGE